MTLTPRKENQRDMKNGKLSANRDSIVGGL